MQLKTSECWQFWLPLLVLVGEVLSCFLRKQIFQTKHCRKGCDLGLLNYSRSSDL